MAGGRFFVFSAKGEREEKEELTSFLTKKVKVSGLETKAINIVNLMYKQNSCPLHRAPTVKKKTTEGAKSDNPLCQYR